MERSLQSNAKLLSKYSCTVCSCVSAQHMVIINITAFIMYFGCLLQMLSCPCHPVPNKKSKVKKRKEIKRKRKRPCSEVTCSCNSNSINYYIVKSLKGLFCGIIWTETCTLSPSYKLTHLLDDDILRQNTNRLLEMFQVQMSLGQKAQGYLVPHNHCIVSKDKIK